MALEGGVAALVLLAAILHASWNTVVKLTGDRLLILALLMGTGGGMGLLALPFLAPPSRESWPFLAASAGLHTAYAGFLALSYRFGDLGHVYPLARGSAPLLVAVLSAALANEVPAREEAAALLLVSTGIASLAFLHGRPAGEGARPVAFALATGVAIASYTVVDGLGVRRSGSPLGYIAWGHIASSLPLLLAALLWRRDRIRAFLAEGGGRSGVGAGIIATVAYGIVIFAMSRSAMASVSALRETSVVFAALIGTRLLGEPFGARRAAASGLVAAGVIWLHAAG